MVAGGDILTRVGWLIVLFDCELFWDEKNTVRWFWEFVARGG